MRAEQTALSAVNACYHNNQLKLGCLLTSQVKGTIATATEVAQLVVMVAKLLYDISPFCQLEFLLVAKSSNLVNK